jgi:filamentous hemagglutinin family protein
MSVRQFNQPKSVHLSTRRASLRLSPVCHAIALMLAASATMSAQAGTNLSNIGAQMSAARNAAAAGGGVNLGVGVSPQQALQASQPSIQNLAHAAQGIAQQIAAQQAAAAAGLNVASNVPNGLAAGGLQVAPGIAFVKDNNGNLVSQNTDSSSPLLWINAYGPKQTSNANGTVDVDIQQTAQNAVLTWQTMNVGRQTTLNFDQSGGTQTNGANGWIVLNRIVDPSGAPSQILGNVTAQGTVLVINRNGILFGAGSQVNVHSLLASSLDLLNTNDYINGTPTGPSGAPLVSGNLVQDAAGIEASNRLFLSLPAGTDGGLAALEAGTSSAIASGMGAPNEILGLGNNVSVTSASQLQMPGNITIEPGASITTSADGSASNGGFVVIAAPNVTNGGRITVAPTGQVILAAGIGLSLQPDASDPQALFPELTGRVSISTGKLTFVDITPAGTLINTGIVQGDRGTIDLLGSNIAQNGVVGVTTSVNTPGSISISTVDEYVANTPTGATYTGAGAGGGTDTSRAGQLIFGNGSVTTILPDTDGETATSAPGTTFTPGSITMTAGSVWFQSGSLIEAPGSSVSVAALTPSAALDATPPGDTAVQGRIYLDTGATIDVSGLANVELPISDILLDVGTINANNLADSPLLRDSFLNGLKGVVVDSTLSGTTSDGLQWVGSPILNLAGAVNLIPRSVDQLLTNGGTITLAGNEVMTADGSSLNLNGGYVHYLGGMVDTTRLIDSSGAIVPIGQASANDTFVGIAGEFVENHPRWNITNDWFNPLLSGGAFEADYIVGGNAGTLNIFASQDMVLDGDITAEAFGGSKQVQGNAQPTGGSFNLGAAIVAGKTASSLTQGDNSSTSGESGTVILQGSAPQLNDLPAASSAGFDADTPLDTAALAALSSTDPNNVLATMVVPVNTLNSGGFANVSITENATGSNGIVVAAGTQLAVQPGGSIKFVSPAADVTVLGGLVAPAGTISISSGGASQGSEGGSIVVGPDALVSVAGQWVNNDTQTAAGTVQGDSEFIDGGSITLSTALASRGSANGGPVVDLSGSITLQAGSVVDVSSGGELEANGQLLSQNGIAQGAAGSLSLLTYATNTTAPFGLVGDPTLPAIPPSAGRIEMDGTIRSFGFSGGGTLTLQALGFQIGGDPTQAPQGDIYLPTDFFERQGFGKYVLNAMYDATVAAGATVVLTQQNLIPDVVGLQQAVTGTDITASLAAGSLTTPGTLDPFHRQPTDLVMTAGADAAWLLLSGQQPSFPGVTGSVTLSEGASILADAGASVGFGSPQQVTVLGSIIAPGGSITLSADSIGNGFALPGQETVGDVAFSNGFTSPGKSVWLGADAVLDVAGVALVNPLAAPVRNGLQTVLPVTGKVLPGGSVTISDDTGYVVAQAGSLIDVSGTSTTFDELQSTGRYAPQPVWSDAGSITLGASDGLFFDGTLQAQPGAVQAQGGTLTLLPQQSTSGSTISATSPGAQILILQQSGDFVPAGLVPGQSFAGAAGGATGELAGVLNFAVDRLDGSGIATLAIGGDPAIDTGNIPAPVPVAFVGNVNLTLPNAVEINTGQVIALSTAEASALETAQINPATHSPYTISALLNADEPAAGPLTPIGTTVTINAPYVSVVGPGNTNTAAFAPIEVAADSTLNINASFIDLENQFQLTNFGEANFTSSGDIRLSSTNAVLTSGINALAPGELFTAGNLTFKAADLYPSTASTFILDAVGPNDASGNPMPTTITFLANGTSGVPLSAGGTLLVDATDIVQGGTVRAPSGSLIFGVGDTADTSTQSQFNNLPLVATNSVTLANGSVTSVSNDGAIIPYGTTVDGVEWQFNPAPNENPAPDLSGPPAKFVSVNGSSVALNAGATIDLSGGGDLQAEEWVPGTGGTRDLLSQYNVSFATTSSGVAVPVNVGAGNVYAILPGAQSPVAAHDPVFAQTVQPSTNANGTVSTITDSIGVGSAALNGAVGQSVYLSGVPGLPAGYYTLLPAKYATLPGAYRVTVSSESGALTPGFSQILPDGTVAVAGYMGNALSGSRSATPTLFDVQSGAVWQQYSQYTLTSANSFFPPLAMSAGNVTPPLPMDAGQLVLAAKQGLTLDATLNTTAAPGGAPAEVDIASQAIQIIGSGEIALPGYLQLSADQLDALQAGSLLIGGTRTQTTSGVSIDPIATSVVVSNDSAHPLTGPEIILVSANGLQVDAGSAIAAQGAYPAAKDQAITITANATTGTSDGALLSVSNGTDSVVTRTGTVNSTGLLTVGAGATLSGGQALTLDSSGNLTFNPAASLSGNVIAVDGSAITFTDQTDAAAASLPGFVAGPAQLAQLANANEVILRSAGTMTFDGTTDLTFGNEVDLSAGVFQSDGGSATINASQITFSNEMGAPQTAGSPGTGSLTVNASQIDFGNGDATVAGFGNVTMNATGGIVAQGNGTLDFGALPVTLSAPVYLANTGSGATIQTTGALTLNSAAGTALTLAPVGGAIGFIGGTLNDNGAIIEAPAGNVSLEATTGDLTIASGSLISSAGVSKPFFDITVFAPAGAIALTADVGTVNVAAGSTLDFSGASGGGAAGSLTLSAPDQTVGLAGTIKGNAAVGYAGGSFSLDTGGAVDLDNLAVELASSGVNHAITVQTNAGNLTLSAGSTITAQTVSLTADGGAGNASDTANGNVIINGTINANGVATALGGAEGGTINLYGKSGVDVEGTLLAEGSDAYLSNGSANPNSAELGGTINIGTTGTPTVGSYNAQYGYENVTLDDSGQIALGAAAKIDVSGGGPVTFAADGLMGGVVNLRAPLLAPSADNTAGKSVDVDLGMTSPGSQIVGARAVNLEAFAVWSTTDTTTGAQHFDGIVDPAGWYSSSGNLVAGTFTVQSTAATPPTFTFTPSNTPAGGGTLTSSATGVSTTVTEQQLESGDPAIGFGGMTNDFFTPTSGDANTAHQVFYGYQANGTTPGTLMGFVENGVQGVATQFANTGIAGFAVVPGVELDNPSPTINGGNISVLTPWNLGAGSASAEADLAFRFNGNEAPVVTFRAENNVKVDASLTDGFFQIDNPISGASAPVPNIDIYGYFSAAQAAYNKKAGPYQYTFSYYGPKGNSNYHNLISLPVNLASADPTEQEEYYALYWAYGNFLDTAAPAQTVQHATAKTGSDYLGVIAKLASPSVGTSQPSLPAPPVAPSAADQLTDPGLYLLYLVSYQTWLNDVVTTFVRPKIPAPTAPFAQLADLVITTSTVSGPGAADNTPSPVVEAGNPLPLLSASLNDGTSSSFRVVAGANLNSANPLALQAVSMFDTTGGGNVTLDGHFADTTSTPGSLALLAPTMIRTGAGSIDIAAANNVALFDSTDAGPIVPGVIYTAGTPALGAPAGNSETVIAGSAAAAEPDIVVTPVVNPVGAGNISIVAQNNITGVENVLDTSTGAVSGRANASISQFWWQWMEVGNPTGLVGSTTPTTQTIQTSIDFGAFDQGVMSVGGNVSVSAGGNISDLAVSLPTTWYLANTNIDNPPKTTVGGGNLMVTAGGNIMSGDYFVANGTGTITAGGQIGSDLNVLNPAGQLTQLPTLLATQAGVLDVNARQGANIGGVFDPSLLESITLSSTYKQQADGQGYAENSAVNVESATGNVELGTLNAVGFIGDDASTISLQSPASVSLTAFTGGITVASGSTLAASATGNLSLIADQSINLANQNGGTTLGMASEAVSSIDETEPVRIYSLAGSIIDGILEPAGSGSDSGFYDHLLGVAVDKPAFIEAGQNIVNLPFEGQNLRDADITRIVAGRDIDDTPLPLNANARTIPSLQLGGPGYFDIEAGRNIGPLTSQAQAFDAIGSGAFPGGGLTTGIDAVGNANNPNLPHESANVQVLFGVGPGIDDAGFISAYINPASTLAGNLENLTGTGTAFMEQYDEGQVLDTGLAAGKQTVTLTGSEAWAQFQALPAYVQQLYVEQVFFTILTDVGNDFNNPSSPFHNQYSRGFQAINTLFPAALGYTANNLGGGSNGANATIQTGNLDIRSTTIQTQQGGNVSILGPGGEALVGSSSAPPEIVSGTRVIAGPGTQGILTLEQGNIDIFTDQSLLLAQSRVFTEQGGDMTIWSSNGNIDAGKGSTSVADVPPPQYVCDANHFCTLDVKGEVTGAGIATLQTIPGSSAGNINLLAPRGTVDAGAAGIRVSGNLNIAALHVLNAANIQVQGKSTGIPVVAAVDTGALTAGSAAASAVTQMAQNLVRNNASGVPQRHWIITVQVEGFGDSDGDDNRRKRKPGTVSYDPTSAVSILGLGAVGNTQRSLLTKEEQGQLGKLGKVENAGKI